jgi:uncharacterized membrane protein
MARLRRLWLHLFAGWPPLRRRFPPALLDEMAQAIAAGERRHRGEIRFAVEARLPLGEAWRGTDARARALEVFARLGVWDTEHNSGVLFYVLMAEHRIEIVADRGIARRVGQEEWDAVCARMRGHYARGEWREGSLRGIADAQALLARHFPGDGLPGPDELPDRPVLL